MRFILLLILLLLLIGALPTWPYSTGWGYYPSGGLGLILLIVINLSFYCVRIRVVVASAGRASTQLRSGGLVGSDFHLYANLPCA